MKKAALAGLLIASAATYRAPASEAPVYRNTTMNVRYVGSKTCTACHPDVAAHYSNTGMARSLRAADNFTLPDAAKLPFTVFDNDRDEYFRVLRHDQALFQGEYGLDSQEKEIFRRDWKISYAIGSGERGIGFLIERDGYLFEAPLSYYTQSKLWSFSPGYERHNYGFTRPVLAECSGCHSGRPQPVYGSPGLYGDPPFAELAVGCENCHGPGELHVAERRAARPVGRVDTSIVNPAHLSGWMSDNICMKCHQAGDVRVEQPGKHDHDYRPGTPLQNVIEIFKAPLRKDLTPGNPVLLEHYYSMTLSKCYRASSGNLHCTSCHDPHIQINGPEAATRWRSKCLACHASHPCQLQARERQKTNPPDDCAGCHMPKRPVVTIAHAALTEHRIVVRPGEPFPREAFEASDGKSALVRITARPSEAQAPVPDIILFQAYAKLISDGHDEFRSRMDEVLARLSRTAPDDGRVLSALARREVQKGSPEDFAVAAAYLTKAVKSALAHPDDFLLLAQLETRANKHDEAITILKAGMRKNPYSPEFPDSLAAEYMNAGDYKHTLEIAQRGLELFPDDKALRALSKQVQSVTLGPLNDSHLP